MHLLYALKLIVYDNAMRLDVFLVKSGLIKTRERAKEAIASGAVFVSGKRATKPSKNIPEGADVFVDDEVLNPYVSRAAYKLLGAIEAWGIDFAGRCVLDIGASTGGFTQVALEQGARRVYAVDVGTGQLSEELLDEARVVSLERLDARTLTRTHIPEPIDIFVSDVSFISIFKILPHIRQFLVHGAEGVVLYKPQFELGREHIGRGGIVVSDKALEAGLSKAPEQFAQCGFVAKEMIPSPIKGKDGNKEYLFLVETGL